MVRNVSAQNEQFIEQAIADGRFVNREEAIERAVQLLREDTSVNGQPTERPETADDWIIDLQNWAASHRLVLQHVDFDRDAIYADRGR